MIDQQQLYAISARLIAIFYSNKHILSIPWLVLVGVESYLEGCLDID